MENRIGAFLGEQAFAFEYVVDVGLGHSGKPGQSAFGEFSLSNASLQQTSESTSQFLEAGHSTLGLFLGEIGHKKNAYFLGISSRANILPYLLKSMQTMTLWLS